MHAVEFLSRFSFMPNKLGYCGAHHASEKIAEYFRTGDEKLLPEINEGLKTFEALYAYLKLIAEKNNADTFDYKVAEAYWIGNELLENISAQDLRKVVLEEFGKPQFLGRELAEKMAGEINEGVLPHHSFHVFTINFMTGKIPAVIENLDKCRIAWGKVLHANENEITLTYKPITPAGDENRKRLIFGEEKEKTILNYFGEEITPGEIIAFHWNAYCKKLDTRESRNLEKFTRISMEA